MLLQHSDTVGIGIRMVAPNYETLAHVPFTPPPGVDDRVSVELSTSPTPLPCRRSTAAPETSAPTSFNSAAKIPSR